MLHVTLRSLLAHKLRLALTALAVVLGVAFVAGTFVLTDTMRSAFDNLFEEVNEGIDVAIRGTQAFQGTFTSGQRDQVPDALVEEVREADNVAAIDFDIEGFVRLLDEDGNPVGNPAAPGLAFNAPLDLDVSTLELRSGRMPEAAGEVAIDAASAALLGAEPGDEVNVVVDGPVTQQEVVGTIGVGDLDSFAGASVILFDLETARELFAPEGGVDVLYAQAVDGVTAEELRDQLAALVGRDYEVQTGDALAADTSADVGQFLGFFTTALLVFAGVSLFVGAFLISNTFTILVAQRTRELALLRAVGAGRRQVLGSVIAEAAITGFVGGLIGLGFGVVLALGLKALLGAFGVDVPTAGLVVSPRTAIVAVVLGVLVTTLSAIGPALKAVRVPPVAAMQAVAAPPPPKVGSLRTAFAVLVALTGIGLLAGGLFGGAGIRVIGAGGGITLLGAALLAPLAARPILVVLGWPVARLRGIRGVLARENALRSPRRSAATASALMIGIGLVTFVMILGASVTASAEAGIERAFLADFQIRAPQTGGPALVPVPEQLVTDLAALPEVAASSPLSFGEFRYENKLLQLLGVDVATYDQILAFDAVDGDLDDLAAGGLAISDDAAADEGFAIGDEVPVEFAATGATALPVVAIFDGANTDFDWVVGSETLAANFQDPLVVAAYVRLAEGVSVAEARPALEAITDQYPNLALQDTEEVKQEVRDQVGQLLGLLSALLLLSVLIALVGIVNTLGLSVLERIRELGLLRAVGMTRRQVRSMVRWESVLIAVLGATFGLGVGVLFGWLVVQALADLGISQFVLPGGQLILAVVLAALAGILAAVLPARRAARIDILRALDAH